MSNTTYKTTNNSKASSTLNLPEQVTSLPSTQD